MMDKKLSVRLKSFRSLKHVLQLRTVSNLEHLRKLARKIPTHLYHKTDHPVNFKKLEFFSNAPTKFGIFKAQWSIKNWKISFFQRKLNLPSPSLAARKHS
jgi:hypothetical protein